MGKILISVFFILISVLNNVSIGQIVQKDSVLESKLPFAIAKEKRLPEEELLKKKEGVYVTGAPDISFDPVSGFGGGAEGLIYFNGKRSDPFFAYTPYRAVINVAAFVTTKLQREIAVGLDVPYIFNTKWRLRTDFSYEVNPNLLYFGIDENSLYPLSYYPDDDSSQTMVSNATYKQYNNNLTGGSKFFNTYTKDEITYNLSMERSFCQGKIRLLAGYEIAYVGISSPLNANSMLNRDNEAHKVAGFGKNLIDFVQFGFIYDTRDLETDPTRGSFAELTDELSLKALGSNRNFNKLFVHYNVYVPLFPKHIKRFTFAGRIGIGYTMGDAPFYEFQDEHSSEGIGIEGLGGGTTLRGYKQSRFLARVMEFNNLELRWRFAQCHFWKQNFAFSAVPFFDAGGVWNNLKNIVHLNNLRISEGIGLRIAWNVNTILRFDYAFSKEDHQFFFTLGHMF